MDSYSYSPLSAEPGHVRLLRLLPRTAGLVDSNQIECELYLAQLGDQQPYDALSYCWGLADKPQHVSIQGKRMPITVNLHAVLTRLSKDGHHTPIWVDAICINQQDIEEKGQQVGQMGQVYKHARSVLVWLGPAEHGSDQALRWIKTVGQEAIELHVESMDEMAMRATIDQIAEVNGPWVSQNSMSSIRHAAIVPTSVAEDHAERTGKLISFFSRCHTSFSDSATTKGLRDALEKFLWRSYWQRAWIIQEICNAQSLRFLCGELEVDERTINAALRLLQLIHDHGYRAEHSLLFPEYGSFRAIAILQIRQLLKNGTPLPLMYLLRHFRRSQSALKVDKIYSLLGIATDVKELGIIPDYSLSDRDGLIKIAQALLQSGYGEILSLCNTRGRMSGLPSWVPDWGELGVQAFLFERGMIKNILPTIPQPDFKAAFKLPLMLQHGFQTQKTTLTLAVLRLGKIEELGRPFEPRRASQWLEDLFWFCPEQGGDVSRCLHIACKTAVADQQSRFDEKRPRADSEILDEVCHCLSPDWPDDLLSVLRSRLLGDFATQLERKAKKRLPMKIADAYVGLAPEHAEVGDEVYVVAGAPVPYILKKVEKTSTFTLIGEAYVHGVMDGEALAAKSAQMEIISVV